MKTPVLRSALLLLRIHLRIQFLTPGVLAVISTPLIFLFVAWFLADTFDETTGIAISTMLVGGLVSGFGMMGAFQITTEMNDNRSNGSLLRMRTLPHGIAEWLLEETLFGLIIAVSTILLTLVGTWLLLPEFAPSLPTAVGLLVLALLGFLANLPWAAILGTRIRSPWSLIVAMLVIMVLYGFTGATFPVSLYPTWLAWLCLLSPFYWLSHGAHWLLLPAEAGVLEPMGAFQPVLVFFVLVVFGLVGAILAPRRVRRSLQRESLTGFAKARETIERIGRS